MTARKVQSLAQWIAALVILGAVFVAPHLRMPAGPDTVAYGTPGPMQPIFRSSRLFSDEEGQRELTRQSRAVLTARYDKLYRENPPFTERMHDATAMHPRVLEFKPDKVTLLFPPASVAPREVGEVEVAVPTAPLLPYLNPAVVQQALPTLTPEFQKARETRLAQVRTQKLVNATRTNVDCAKLKCIALTFDDGPDGKNGPRIIHALRERHAVGTFFVVGKEVRRHPEELRLALAAGNEIGNHTWSHPNLTELSDRDIDWQIDRTNEAITAVTGLKPTFMRPPGGRYTPHTNQTVKMPVGLWNVDTRDWDFRDKNHIITHTLGHARPGSIILMHSIYPSTAAAVPEIIDKLQQQGYVLVTMSELFGVTPQNYPTFVGKPLLKR